MPRPRSTLFPYTTLFRSTIIRSAPRRMVWTSSTCPKVSDPPPLPSRRSAYPRTRSDERFSRNAETEIYTLSLHDALPIYHHPLRPTPDGLDVVNLPQGERPTSLAEQEVGVPQNQIGRAVQQECRDRDLHSFPTRRSSDLPSSAPPHAGWSGRRQPAPR